ncbi:MAG TPA: DNA polymerase I [Candidatus Nanopelagicaceae bacterium]|nr:DNA polymerase I [Candidatus Nanopelagicaceae bacterium]
MARNRLLLLDGHSLAYRAFYALPVSSFATADGRPTNAVYGFTSMLLNLIRDEKPTHLAVAFDVSRQTFRTERFSEYKANRASSPDEFKGQVELIKEVLMALNIPALEVAGFEADDIIATLVHEAKAGDYEILICTGDRDTFQLVDHTTTVLYPKKGVSEMARMTPTAIEEKYSLTPEQYPDFAALRGDPSDNLPGVPGVGEKTAQKWIVQYGSLSELVQRAPELTGKVGDSFRKNLGQVLLNRELTQLRVDVPLSLTPAQLVRQEAEAATVNKVLDSLEFRSLKNRIAPLLGTEIIDRVPLEVEQIKNLGPWLSRHEGPTALAIDGIGNIAFARSSKNVGWMKVDSVRDWLQDSTAEKIAHDAKTVMHSLGLQMGGLVGDTAVEAYLIAPGVRGNSLPELVERYLGYEISDRTSPDSTQIMLELPTGEDLSGLTESAAAIYELDQDLKARLAVQGGNDLLLKVELPLISLLAKMELSGIAVDRKLLQKLVEGFERDGNAAIRAAHEAVGHEFNLASPKQLQGVLFDELKLPKTKKIKSGYTTDAEALTELFAKTEHPVLAQILRFRDVTKLRTTIEGLQRAIASDGRIHTTFQQTVAATGRLSSTDPNLQNIPVRSEEGRRIRECFIVGEGFSTLLTADYSQIEMRIMAHLSEDEALLEAFHGGEDLHTTVAAEVFGVEPTEVDARMRSQIKAMSYGLAYGLSSYGLSAQLGIGDAAARDLMDRYFERFGKVRDYLRRVVEEARRTGYTESLLGRRRYLPDLNSDNRQRRETAERMALNSPIQGSAADIVKVAMLKVDAELNSRDLKSRILLQVHDELVLEVAEGELEKVRSIVEDKMGSAYPLNAPLSVNIGIGRSWDDAAH